MKRGIRLLLASAITLFLVPSVFALNSELGFEEFLEQIGQILYTITTNEYASFAIISVVLTIFFKSIFIAGIKRVNIFQGEGAEGVSRSGQALGWSLALLTTLSIIYSKGSSSVGEFLSNVLGPFGIYGIAAVAIFIYMVVRKSTESRAIPLLATGGILFWSSGIVDNGIATLIGVFLIAWGLFRGLRELKWSVLGKKDVSPGEAARVEGREQETTQQLEQLAQREEALERQLAENQQLSQQIHQENQQYRDILNQLIQQGRNNTP